MDRAHERAQLIADTKAKNDAARAAAIADKHGVTHVETCSHSLDDIAGYEIRLSLDNGHVVDPSPDTVVATVNGGHRYALAFGLADALRDLPARYALIDTVCNCGHIARSGR